jgi:hypothetical protein
MMSQLPFQQGKLIMSNILTKIIEGSFAGISSKVWLIAFAVLSMVAGVIIKVASDRDDKLISSASNAGASSAVIAGQNDVIEQVEKANAAEQEMRNSGDAGMYARCMQNSSASSRSNCDRFRPVSD